MFRSTFFKFVIIFNVIGILLVAGMKYPSSYREVIAQVKTYPNVMELALNGRHERYVYSYLDRLPHASHAESSSDQKRVIDMVIWYLNEGKFVIAYAVIRDVLESVCFTYMYRFCVYAWEINTRGGDLAECFENFQTLMSVIVKIFIKEEFPMREIKSLMNIYYYYNAEHLENRNAVADSKNSEKLLDFMKLVERSIYFVQIGTYDQQYVQGMQLEELESFQQNEFNEAVDLLKKVAIGIEIEGERLCDGCNRNVGSNVEIAYCVPCGHLLLDYCLSCSYQSSRCRVCQNFCVRSEVVKIVRPTSLLGYDFWDRIPRNDIDQMARCIKCRNEEPLKKKMIAIPCGHGFYCQKCIGRKKCLVCESRIKKFMVSP